MRRVTRRVTRRVKGRVKGVVAALVTAVAVGALGPAPASGVAEAASGTKAGNGDATPEETRRTTATGLRTGLGWQTVSAGELGTQAYLGSVSGAGPLAAWAAGYQVVDARPRGVLLRWDGWQWRPDTAPGLPEVTYWLSVSARSPFDVWAYGRVAGEEYVLARFDGVRWRTVEPPAEPDGGGYGVTHVAAVAGRTWLAGDDAISSYHDGAWHTLRLAEGSTVVDLHARAADDAWAVGPYWPTGQADARRPLVLHWDGREWAEVPLARPELRPEKVYAQAADSVYMLAESYEDDGYRVLHWDGERWHDLHAPLDGVHPAALGGDGHGTVWVGCESVGTGGPTVYWGYDKRGWRRETGEPVTGQGRTFGYGVTDLAPLGGVVGDLLGGMWAVGTYTASGEPFATPHELVEFYGGW